MEINNSRLWRRNIVGEHGGVVMMVKSDKVEKVEMVENMINVMNTQISMTGGKKRYYCA